MDSLILEIEKLNTLDNDTSSNEYSNASSNASNTSSNKDLILSNLQEVISDVDIPDNLSIYWGTAPTGEIHLGYLIPFQKIKDFTLADCDVTILIADKHAMLDALKTSFELVNARSKYYETIITDILTRVGANTKKIKFVRGSSFQNSPEYINDFYKLLSITDLREAKKAGTDVVKQNSNPNMGSLVYPLMQALDEVYLKTQAQLGGIDQRKIFMYAKALLPKIGYTPTIYLMNPMMSLTQDGAKMSSSIESNTKILFTDSSEVVTKKVLKLFCDPNKPFEENPASKLFKIVSEILEIEYTKTLKLFETSAINPKEFKMILVDRINQLNSCVTITKELINEAYPN